MIQSHRSVALKIHFRPNAAVAAARSREKEKEKEKMRKGEKPSFVETAYDIRVMERVIGEKSLVFRYLRGLFP